MINLSSKHFTHSSRCRKRRANLVGEVRKEAEAEEEEKVAKIKTEGKEMKVRPKDRLTKEDVDAVMANDKVNLGTVPWNVGFKRRKIR